MLLECVYIDFVDRKSTQKSSCVQTITIGRMGATRKEITSSSRIVLLDTNRNEMNDFAWLVFPTTFCSAISRDDKMNHFWHEDTSFDLNMPNMRLQTQYISWTSSITTTTPHSVGFYEQAFFGFPPSLVFFFSHVLSIPHVIALDFLYGRSPFYKQPKRNYSTLLCWSFAWSAFKL